MQRRQFAKAVGGIAGTTALGGAALVAGTGGASASAGGSISDPEAVESDDGEISYVAVQSTGRLTWDGFDTAVKQARIMVYVTLKRNGSTVWGENLIHDTERFELDDSWGGSGEDVSLDGDHEAGQSGYIASDTDWGICQENRENEYNDGYGLPSDPAPTAPFTADDDGTNKATRVVLRSVYLLYDADGNELTGQSGYPDRPETQSAFTVTVGNQESTVGIGDEDGDGDTEDDATVGV